MRFGLVGTGYWAKMTHAPALAGLPGAELAAVWGRDPAAAADLAAAYGAASPAGFDAFLDEVDAVAFAVPPHVQAPLAIRAAQAGKHLLLEKPVALAVEEADKLAAAVDEAQVASVVFFTWRFNREIRAWLTDEQARGGWSGEGWSGGAAIWLGTALAAENPFDTPWRREKGALWDLGPHLVGMLWACLGPVTEVTAVAGKAGVTHLVLRHQTGVTSTVTTTLSAPEAAAGVTVFVWGEAGRSVMPAELVDPVAALRTAAAELMAGAAEGRLAHPCDVRFGRDITRVLAEAEAQLSLSPLPFGPLYLTAPLRLGLAGMSTPSAGEPRNLRASDADRERTANVLREAAGDGRLTMDELDERLDAVYAARTYAELEPITHDLPATGEGYVPAVPAAATGDPARFGGEATSSGAVAILGGFSRKGDWTVPKEFTAFCFMGGGEIDMRDARFAEREVTIHIVAIMGGCEIIVPEDATVRVTGVGIMGAFDHSDAGSGGAGGPVITVNGVAIMGGVDVKRRPTMRDYRDRQALRQDERRQRLEARMQDRTDRHELRRERHARRWGELD